LKSALFPVIYGADKQKVLECRRRVLQLVASARQRQEPTHFLSLPFTSTQIRLGAQQFRDSVLADFSHVSLCEKRLFAQNTTLQYAGIDEKVFLAPEKLHLTIGMLVLNSESERNEAKKALDSCADEIIRFRVKHQPEFRY